MYTITIQYPFAVWFPVVGVHVRHYDTRAAIKHNGILGCNSSHVRFLARSSSMNVCWKEQSLSSVEKGHSGAIFQLWAIRGEERVTTSYGRRRGVLAKVINPYVESRWWYFLTSLHGIAEICWVILPAECQATQVYAKVVSVCTVEQITYNNSKESSPT